MNYDSLSTYSAASWASAVAAHMLRPASIGMVSHVRWHSPYSKRVGNASGAPTRMRVGRGEARVVDRREEFAARHAERREVPGQREVAPLVAGHADEDRAVGVRSGRAEFEGERSIAEPRLAARMEQLFEERRDASREITLADVRGRSVRVKLRDGVARLLSPYL